MSGHPNTALSSALQFMSRMEWILTVILLFGISCAVVADVVARELGHGGVRGAAGLSTLMMISMGFIGISFAVSENRHLEVPSLAIGAKVGLPGLERIRHTVSTAICWYFAWHAVQFVVETYEFGDETLYLHIPLWIPQLAIPYAFLSSGLRYFAFAIDPSLKPSSLSA